MKLAIPLKTTLGLERGSEAAKAGENTPVKSPDSPSPTKRAGKAGTDLDDSLLTGHADEAFDSLSHQELLRDACSGTKARKDKLTVQTSSSSARFKNDPMVDPSSGDKQRERNFNSFLPTSKEACVSGSGTQTQSATLPRRTAKDVVNTISKNGMRQCPTLAPFLRIIRGSLVHPPSTCPTDRRIANV